MTPLIRNLSAVIDRMCADPKTTATQLAEMSQTLRAAQDDAKRDAFYFAMSMCQSELPDVAAKTDNNTTNSKYANLATIYAAAKPITTAYGFSLSTYPATSTRTGFLSVDWILRHCDGHSESGTSDVPIDGYQTNTTHGFGSSNSYARRYIFCMAFDIVITREDDDGNKSGNKSVETVNTVGLQAIRDRAASALVTEAEICRVEGIETLSDLPRDRTDTVIRKLGDKIKSDAGAKLGKPITADLGEDA